MFVQKIRTFNGDEIDGRLPYHSHVSYSCLHRLLLVRYMKSKTDMNTEGTLLYISMESERLI